MFSRSSLNKLISILSFGGLAIIADEKHTNYRHNIDKLYARISDGTKEMINKKNSKSFDT